MIKKELSWKRISCFNSPGEYKLFCKYIHYNIKDGLAEEIKPDPDYGEGQVYGGRWFKNKSTGEIWRLIEPDFPFKGLWEKVTY